MKVWKVLTGGSVLARPACHQARPGLVHQVGGRSRVPGADVVQPVEVVLHHLAVWAQLEDDQTQHMAGKLERPRQQRQPDHPQSEEAVQQPWGLRLTGAAVAFLNLNNFLKAFSHPSHFTFTPMKTAARDLSSSLTAWSSPDLVMARVLAWGLNRKEREDSSSRSVETARLVSRDQRPPGTVSVTLTL